MDLSELSTQIVLTLVMAVEALATISSTVAIIFLAILEDMVFDWFCCKVTFFQKAIKGFSIIYGVLELGILDEMTRGLDRYQAQTTTNFTTSCHRRYKNDA